MKYSLRILFLACVVVALVANLAMQHNDWSAIASVGLGALVFHGKIGSPESSTKRKGLVFQIMDSLRIQLHCNICSLVSSC